VPINCLVNVKSVRGNSAAKFPSSKIFPPGRLVVRSFSCSMTRQTSKGAARVPFFRFVSLADPISSFRLASCGFSLLQLRKACPRF
jgi:hypothetical protein